MKKPYGKKLYGKNGWVKHLDGTWEKISPSKTKDSMTSSNLPIFRITQTDGSAVEGSVLSAQGQKVRRLDQLLSAQAELIQGRKDRTFILPVFFTVTAANGKITKVKIIDAKIETV